MAKQQLNDAEGLPEGSRWLHLWTTTDRWNRYLQLGVQVEQVGVRISAAGCVTIEPTAAAVLFDLLATLPGARRVDCGVSVRLDVTGEGD